MTVHDAHDLWFLHVKYELWPESTYSLFGLDSTAITWYFMDE